MSTVSFELIVSSYMHHVPCYQIIYLFIYPHCFLFRFTEKGNLEVLLFTIQSKMRANNQKVYMPREGKLISDINKVNIDYIYRYLIYLFSQS